MKTPALAAKEIKLRLKAAPNWSRRGQTIVQTFEFAGFPQSIAFVERVARKAQASDHHPDIDIRFNKVKLTLSSHDAGGLTEKDFALAQQCDAAFARVRSL